MIASAVGAALDVVHGGGGCTSGCGPLVKMKERPGAPRRVPGSSPMQREPPRERFRAQGAAAHAVTTWSLEAPKVDPSKRNRVLGGMIPGP